MRTQVGGWSFTSAVRGSLALLVLAACAGLAGCESAPPPAPPAAPSPPPLPRFLEAVERGDVEQVKQLVAAGENVNQVTRGTSALSIAVRRCDQPMTQTLISLGVAIDPNLNYTVAQRAIPCNNLALVSMLASLKGAELDIRQTWKDSYTTTPLGIAVANGQTALVRLLLEKGADVNGRCRLGRCEGKGVLSPLHVAARTANVEMVRLLVNRNADTVVLDQDLLAPIIHLLLEKAGSEAQTVEIIKILAVRGIASVKYVSPRGPALAFVPDQWKEASQLLISLGASRADVDRFARDEAAHWKKVEEEEAARIARDKAARAAAEAGANEVAVGRDNSGNCTCTRRSQRWVAQRSASGQVKGNMGHFEFYDEKVPCACQ